MTSDTKPKGLNRPDVHYTIPENYGNDCGRFQPGSIEALAGIFKQALTGIDNPFIGELGTWIGSSTITTAKELKQYGGHLLAIDWFKGSGGTNQHLRDIAAKTNVFSIFMKNIGYSDVDNVSILNMDSESASKLIEGRPFDVFFIDADHRYEYIKRDIGLWLPKVKKGGILCGHDYSTPHPGIIKAVYETFGGDNFGTLKERGTIWWVEV